MKSIDSIIFNYSCPTRDCQINQTNTNTCFYYYRQHLCYKCRLAVNQYTLLVYQIYKLIIY